MNEKTVMTVEGYDRVDGRNAYRSAVKKMTLGTPQCKENQNMQIAAQLWKENIEGELEISIEIPIHQVFDLMIFLSRTLLYFKEAYRFPLLYDPENPMVERIGIQGDVLPVEICIQNPDINQEIKVFSQALSDLGELTGERLRTLTRIIEELEVY
ncbi:DUF6530 family protein [Lachnospiraceae bacterium OttesenSCG-928-J05]|nr:DUF6530 family protein [Lachnospiraceae bacterium OttesenSCG-928-J05]MDL2276343.1 DUF6530 family protein [Breznakia sp. OttesenSCG-928-G09]